MANNRKRKTIIEEVLPDTATNEGDTNIDASDLVIAGSKIYKLNNGSKSFCMVTTEPVDEVFIQSQYPNGGKFVVLEFNQMNELLHQNHYEIEPKTMAVAINGNGGSGGNDIQIRMLFEELNFTRQMLMQQLQNNKGNGGGSISELVAALAGLHQLAPGGKDPVELIIKGMELGSRNTGATDWKTELLSTIKEVAPSAIQAVAMSNRQPNGQQPMLVASPEDNLKQGLQWIKSKIVGGMSTDLAVEWLISNANDPQYHHLLSTAIQGTVDNFIAIDPEIANEPYRTWFTNAINEIKGWYAEQQQQEQPATDTDLDGRIRDNPNVTANAPVSTRKPKLAKTV